MGCAQTAWTAAVQGAVRRLNAALQFYRHCACCTTLKACMPQRVQPCTDLNNSHLTDGLHLRLVAHQGAGGMRVDVVDLIPLNAAVLERQINAGGHAQAIGVGVGHVVRVARHRACSSKAQHRREVRRQQRFRVACNYATACLKLVLHNAWHMSQGKFAHYNPANRVPPRYSARMVAPRFCACSRLSMISTPGEQQGRRSM